MLEKRTATTIILSLVLSAILLTVAFAEPIYTDETVIDKIEVLENGTIQARKCLRVYKDGVLIGQKYINRYIFTPDKNITEIEIQRVKDIAGVMWTEKVKDDYLKEKDKIIE